MDSMVTVIIAAWRWIVSCLGTVVLVCFLVSLVLFIAELIVYRRKKR